MSEIINKTGNHAFDYPELYDDSGVHLALQGSGGNLNPWVRFNSSSRMTMFTASHIGQIVPIRQTTPRRCTTGMEFEYGKFTTAITMPVNGSVITIIPKFKETAGRGGIRNNPYNALIYDNHDSEYQEVELLDLASHRSDHVTFGYRYKYRDFPRDPGSPIRKDTVIASSGNLKENGDYNFGLEANVCFMSHPMCIEDGIGITDSFAKKLGSDTFHERVLNIDRDAIPVDLYGSPHDLDDYRFMADIGEQIRPDGVVFATREICPTFGFLTLTKKALRTLQETDKIYRAPANSIVTDIDCHEGSQRRKGKLSDTIVRQAKFYADALSDFYSDIRKQYWKLERDRQSNLRIGPNFHRLIVDALADQKVKRPNNNTVRTYRKDPLKLFRVKVTLVSELLARIGHKLTDTHGFYNIKHI